MSKTRDELCRLWLPVLVWTLVLGLILGAMAVK